jgi:hypothetical protein
MIEHFIKDVQIVTLNDKEQGLTEDHLLKDAIEELGEYAAAKTVESGRKDKILKESSRIEAVDMIICSLALFFHGGGTIDQLDEIGQNKLNKWKNRMANRTPEHL